MEIKVRDLGELPEAAKRVLEALPESSRILAFHGGMGVGKTTFIAALCEQLGVEDDEVNSPTFAIVNHYQGKEGDIFHFDMYRLEDETQAFDVGAEELLNSGSWCFVEWPENTPDILPEGTIHIYIEEKTDGSRKISMI